MSPDVFAVLESEVRGYCRSFPVVFDRADGSRLFARDGRAYLDFFSGAGALNYGHNPRSLRQALLAYLERGGVTHSLDMMTVAKAEFLERFHGLVLGPRGMSYKIQFPGPTGTNSVEAALKLARKVTGRHTVVSFTNAFHGMTLGALAVTGNSFKRHGAGVPLNHTVVMPYCNYMDDELDSLAYFEAMLSNSGSGVDVPAAVILETVQAEGGINVASFAWLRRLESLCKRHEILLIVDDIQVGCGRTGPFFSFEPAGLKPDMICLSKSLSGYGLPMAVTLIRPDLDVWSPGEHNGTFRGHNPAFVTAAAALGAYWADDALQRQVEAKAIVVSRALESTAMHAAHHLASVRGRGLIQGIAFETPGLARSVSEEAFARGLIVETAGPDESVIKLMPPLNIEGDALRAGLQILDEAVSCAARAKPAARPPVRKKSEFPVEA
jgi:diaminobutyrate-2-oxoglutarate transaminase